MNRFEAEYQRAEQKGITSWFERMRSWAIDPHDRRFFEDLLSQSWAPGNGSVVEFGCGAGQFLRWICSRGYSGLGIDVSKTAIELANHARKNFEIEYRVANVCAMPPGSFGSHDLCIDGRMSHFLVDENDRNAFFANARAALKPHGIFVFMAMCGPIDDTELNRLYPGQKVSDAILYTPFHSEEAGPGEERYIPQNYVPHWSVLLEEVMAAAFEPVLIRFSRHAKDEPVSSVNIAAQLSSERRTNRKR